MPRPAVMPLLETPAEPQRRSRTLSALISAGKRLVSDGRMDTATIDEIVREANISKRSFHNHFVDKRALVDQVLTDVRLDLEREIAKANEGVEDMATDLARGMLVSFRYGMDRRLSERVMLHVEPGVADPGSPRNLALAANLRKGAAQGSFKLASVDAGVVLVLALSDLGLSRLLLLRDERRQARALMRDICLLLLRGLGVDARRLERVTDAALGAIIDSPAHASGPSGSQPA